MDQEMWVSLWRLLESGEGKKMQSPQSFTLPLLNHRAGKQRTRAVYTTHFTTVFRNKDGKAGQEEKSDCPGTTQACVGWV